MSMKILLPMVKATRKMIRPMARACTRIKAKRPELYAGAGALMIIGGFIWVINSSMKAPKVMEETSDAVKDVEEKYKEELENAKEEQKEDILKRQKKDLKEARRHGTWRMVKLFAGPTCLVLGGIAAGTNAVTLLRKENIGLAAAAEGGWKALKFYRKNVVADQGEEADKKYMRGVVGEKEVVDIQKDENGQEVKVSRKVPVVRSAETPWRFEYSPYFFRSATGQPERDLHHLKMVQDYFDHKYGGVKKFGTISLYEILEFLEINWEVVDPGTDHEVEMFCRNNGYGHHVDGDDFIDLGIYRAINESAIAGDGDTVYIEFNADGPLCKCVNKYTQKYKTKKEK